MCSTADVVVDVRDPIRFLDADGDSMAHCTVQHVHDALQSRPTVTAKSLRLAHVLLLTDWL